MYSENQAAEQLPHAEQQAREIARAGDYEAIVEQLSQEGLLSLQVERVKNAYGSHFEDATFMTAKEWEMLTIIELYSRELVTHSIETYEIAKDKIERLTFNNELLKDVILHEDVSLDEFYRTCVFHDIGKIFIPHEIHNNALDSNEWFKHLYRLVDEKNPLVLDNLELPSDNDYSTTDIDIHLQTLDTQPNDIIPVRLILSQNETDKIEARGISGDRTLHNIMKMHETMSEETLMELGFENESVLAGQHHNYDNEDLVHPITTKVIGVTADLSDILHLADMKQAMTNKRIYKEGWRPLSVIEGLVADAEKGRISKTMTALWVEDELNAIPKDQIDPSEKVLLGKITSFIEQNS